MHFIILKKNLLCSKSIQCWPHHPISVSIKTFSPWMILVSWFGRLIFFSTHWGQSNCHCAISHILVWSPSSPFRPLKWARDSISWKLCESWPSAGLNPDTSNRYFRLQGLGFNGGVGGLLLSKKLPKVSFCCCHHNLCCHCLDEEWRIWRCLDQTLEKPPTAQLFIHLEMRFKLKLRRIITSLLWKKKNYPSLADCLSDS